MPLEFQLPKCLATTLQTMYPTLHIDPGQYNDCISWYIGLPAPYSLGSQLAMTMSRNKSIHIYIREEEYEPCTRHFFRTCVHELVHALQIRQAPAGGRGAGIFNFFSFNYLTCYVRTISDEDRDNRYEREAYDHEDVVDDALTQTGGELPCACSATMPVASPNPAFKGVSALAKIHPSVIMKEATQTGPCNALVMSFGLGSLNRSAPFWQSREFFDLLGWLLLSLAGWLFGIPLPFGVLGGLALGILDVGTGIPSGILLFGVLIFGAILDGIISGIRAITEAFWPGDHPLKLIFSADDGLTFDNEGIVGITSAPPALAFGSSELFVGWTEDGHWKILSVGSSGPFVHEGGEANDDAGPALLSGGGKLYLLWQREENKLYSRVSASGTTFNNRVMFGGKTPDDATPGLAYGNARAWAMWIRKRNNKMGIKSSSDGGATWGMETTFDDIRSGDDGSAALAFGGGRLFLAWAGKAEQRLHVGIFNTNPNGWVSYVSRYDLGVQCATDTGPAVAFGNNRLFVAWTGRSEGHLHVRSYDVNAGGGMTLRSDISMPNQRSRLDAGPALAYGFNTLCLAWSRKNA